MTAIGGLVGLISGLPESTVPIGNQRWRSLMSGTPNGWPEIVTFSKSVPKIWVPKYDLVDGIMGQVLIGCASVSTANQDLSLQLDALTKAGCEKLFTDKASGAKVDRPGLAAALHFARAGDTLVIWKLDRLGRSIQGLIALAGDRRIGRSANERRQRRRAKALGHP